MSALKIKDNNSSVSGAVSGESQQTTFSSVELFL
jgi:hypothetical protein